MIGRSKFNERIYDMTPNGESLDISETQKKTKRYNKHLMLIVLVLIHRFYS